VSIEARTRKLLGSLEDMPDWAYMKAIELSRAMDEGDLTGESLAVTMILMTTALDRRLKILEGDAYTQEHWNHYFDANIDYIIEVMPHDPAVWDAGEDDEEEEEEE
jgi:hypothetical protein